jgi:endo-1,4-beta-xylanase
MPSRAQATPSHHAARLLACALAAVGLAACASRPPAAPAPPPGTLLIAPGAWNFSLPDACTAATIPLDPADAPDPAIATALRLTIDRAYQPAYQAQLFSAPTTAAIALDDHLLVSCWLRTAPGIGSTGSLLIRLQQPVDPWDAAVEGDCAIGPAWRYVQFPAIAQRDWPAGSLEIAMHLGRRAQTIDVADLTVRDLGWHFPAQMPPPPLRWPGMQPDATWRDEAWRCIRLGRMADLSILVTDAAGNPLPNAIVTVDQQRTAFTVGSVLDWQDSLDGEHERTLAADLFNRATVPIYWGDDGWPTHRDDILRIAAWDHDHGFATRLHPLVYPAFRYLPHDLAALAKDPAALQAALLAHIRDVAAAFHGLPPREVDVANELRDCTEITDLVGRDAVAAWFAEARRDFPGAKLALNENSILSGGGDTKSNQDNLLDWYRFLKSRGQAPDVIGFQSHFGATLTSPTTVWTILDRFAKETDAELQITEFDLNVPGDEYGQADYTRDFLTACFAHPRVGAITLWGFWEGDHWRPDAALWRKDWSAKPNGTALKDLLASWSTHAATKTDATGHATVPAYLGDLLVGVNANGHAAATTVHLVTPGKTVALILAMPK